MKKRVICMFVLVLCITLFFSFTVNAEGFTPVQEFSNQQLNSGVITKYSILRLGVVNDGTASIQYGSYSPILIQFSFYNQNDQAAYIYNPGFYLNITGGMTRNWVRFENYSTDIYLDLERCNYSTGSYAISGGNGFGYTAGVIVPPHDEIRLMCLIGIGTEYDFNTGSYNTPRIDSVSLYGFTVTLGNYPYGIPNSTLIGIDDKLQQIIDSMDDVNNTQDVQDDSDDVITNSDTVHQAEVGFYQQNQQALANSGISNPNFEATDRTSINEGMAASRNLFTTLWSNIGPLRNIYMYALMMCLATYMIRHKVWVRHNRR